MKNSLFLNPELPTSYAGFPFSGLLSPVSEPCSVSRGPFFRPVGIRQYELTDHLGNVMVTVSDRKDYSIRSSSIYDSKYHALHLSFTDYYPFGLPIAERSWTGDDYRFGFNGQEKDDEIYGEGASYTAEFWQYDSRLGRRWNVEPNIFKYPNFSSYLVLANNPILYFDPNGLDWLLATGNKVIWYSGDYGDRTTVINTYKSTSGIKDATLSNGTSINLQYAFYQFVKNGGPTVEGRYKLMLNADPNRKAQIKNGQIIRADVNGIENLENMTDPTRPGFLFNSDAWGKNRVRLIPVEVSQPKNPSTGEPIEGDAKRDLNSFYFHDSEKGYSSGCIEIESAFFEDLIKYQNEGNQIMEVLIEYSSPEHNTNGGTGK